MINKQSKIDVYPIPWIDEILDCLYKAQVFSKIDLIKGYHQDAVELSHAHKTTFLTKFGLFKFLLIPIRLVNATAIF